MARPRKGEEKHRPKRLTIRTSEDVRDRLDAEAEARQISISDIIEEALLKHWQGQRWEREDMAA